MKHILFTLSLILSVSTFAGEREIKQYLNRGVDLVVVWEANDDAADHHIQVSRAGYNVIIVWATAAGKKQSELNQAGKSGIDFVVVWDVKGDELEDVVAQARSAGASEVRIRNHKM